MKNWAQIIQGLSVSHIRIACQNKEKEMEKVLFSNSMAPNESNELLDKFKEKFIVADYNLRNQRVSRLLWCNLSCEGEVIPINEFDKINVAQNTSVYFYNERENKMFRVRFSEVINLIINIEPWEEYDAEIFDDSFQWFIAITHEDFCILDGL